MYGYGGTFAAQPKATNLTTQGSYYVDCGQQGVIMFNVTTMCAYTLWRNPWYNNRPVGTGLPRPAAISTTVGDSLTEIRTFIGNPTSEPTTDTAGNWWQLSTTAFWHIAPTMCPPPSVAGRGLPALRV